MRQRWFGVFRVSDVKGDGGHAEAPCQKAKHQSLGLQKPVKIALRRLLTTSWCKAALKPVSTGWQSMTRTRMNNLSQRTTVVQKLHNLWVPTPCSGFPKPNMGCAAFVQHDRANAFNGPGRRIKYITARQFGIFLFSHLSPENPQSYRIDTKNYPANT